MQCIGMNDKEYIDSLTVPELREIVLKGMQGNELALDRLLELRELAVRAEYDKELANSFCG